MSWAEKKNKFVRGAHELMRRHDTTRRLWKLAVDAFWLVRPALVYVLEYLGVCEGWWSLAYRKRTRQRYRDRSFVHQVVEPAASSLRANHRITPQSAAAAIAAQAAPPTDRFFGRLPFDLRYAVYHLAFPPRMLHLYLRYETPNPPAATVGRNRRKSVREKEAENRWVWAGSVCCPSNPTHEQPAEPADLSHGRRSGIYAFCASRVESRVFPPSLGVNIRHERCSDGTIIGISPWLRTCRQAYVEGMSHLYGQNTIILVSPPLLRGFQDFVSPCITFLITSLEITWTPFDVPMRDGFMGTVHAKRAKPNRSQTWPVFPNLRHLRIFLRHLDNWSLDKEDRRAPAPDSSKGIATDMLVKLDRLLPRIVPPTAEVIIAYSGWQWYKILDTLLIDEQGLHVTRPQMCENLGGPKCWRQMPATAATTALSGQPTPQQPGRGYWFYISRLHVSNYLEQDASDYEHQELYGFRTAPHMTLWTMMNSPDERHSRVRSDE